MCSTLSLIQTLKIHACACSHLYRNIITGFDIALIRTSRANCLHFEDSLENMALYGTSKWVAGAVSQTGGGADLVPCHANRLRCLGKHSLPCSLGCPFTFPRAAVYFGHWISSQFGWLQFTSSCAHTRESCSGGYRWVGKKCEVLLRCQLWKHSHVT